MIIMTIIIQDEQKSTSHHRAAGHDHRKHLLTVIPKEKQGQRLMFP